MLTLGLDGFTYADLYDPARLADLTTEFRRGLAGADADLDRHYGDYLAGAELGPVEESTLLLALAPHLSGFVTRLFGIQGDAAELARGITELGPIWAWKKTFLGKTVKRVKDAELEGFDADGLDPVVEALIAHGARTMAGQGAHDAEAAFATVVLAAVDSLDSDAALALQLRPLLEPNGLWKGPEAANAWLAALLADLARWCRVRGEDPKASAVTRDWTGFKTAERVDFDALVKVEHPRDDFPELTCGPAATQRRRDGFELTDRRYSRKQVLAEVDYCILCHERDKDSCTKGVLDKQGAIARNPLGIKLAGCPLDEKISEMHAAYKAGDAIAALSIIMIDNPMCPGTGHRICNDCMKACIYQKFEPVNIPQIETRVLTDVLALPWGFEVYSLLVRWNPLNRRRPHDLPYNGTDVLVVGLGPAGYTLAHYLNAEGFGVIGIDGLKIEPLPSELTGRTSAGEADAGHSVPQPVRDFETLYEELDERPLAGFGGVAEYGITVRWDKNFLKVIRIALERRAAFRAYGGVRFGGTVTLEDAWEAGFGHVAIAAGAGKPTVPKAENNLVRGVRTASDFLMALQLTGASKADSVANLQVRLPAVVIGGGLTAIDTATELAAYYPVQVAKVLTRYETLIAELGEASVHAGYAPEELETLLEFVEHGRAVRAERERAAAAGELPNFAKLVQGWGGVTLAYRKSMHDSPAYRLNHEEIIKALEEGIWYAEGLSPVRAETDEHDALCGVVFEKQAVTDGRWRGTGEELRLPARAMFLAAGTSPNVMYERERPGTFAMDKWDSFFAQHRIEGEGAAAKPVTDDGADREDTPGVFTSYAHEGRFVSYFGDNHPAYAGNVVKAMASARDGFHQIVDVLREGVADSPATTPEAAAHWRELTARLDDTLVARVERVERLTPTIVEVVVRAPAAAKHFRPGQFFRVQNYEASAPLIEGARLAAEGLALTGAWVDAEAGLLSTIVLEMGGSSNLCEQWKPGEEIVVMGPTGAPTEIPTGETVILLGGGLGNAVQFSIGRAMREAGNRVIYFAAYKHSADLYHVDDIEAACDTVVWSVDAGDPVVPRRPQDRSTVGNVLEAMERYAAGELGDKTIELSEASRIIAIGSDRMMAAVKAAIHGRLRPLLKDDVTGIGSINSPMQCMMKAICGQCLQRHVDPETGREVEPVFSCFNQDQCLDAVDFDNLNTRLRANSVLEKLTRTWLAHMLRGPRQGASGQSAV